MRPWGWLLAVALGSGGWAWAQTAPAVQPTQAQVARRFLQAAVRGNYTGAYGYLAPEVARYVSLARFRTAARPLYTRGLRKGTGIQLYKLGVRLEGQGSARLFYSFSFLADSVHKTPPVLLEVTFRDTTSRRVLAFGMREQAAQRVPVKASPAPARKNPAPQKTKQ